MKIKALNTLLKVKTKELNETKGLIAKLYNQHQELQNNCDQLDQQMIHEEKFVLSHPETVHAFQSFKQQVLNQQIYLKQQMQTVQIEMDKIIDYVFDAFVEMKRYEIIRDNQVKAFEKEQQKLEEVQAEEATSIGFLRTQAENDESKH